MSRVARRSAKLARYEELRAQRPHLFENPDGGAYEILFDRADQDHVSDETAAALREQGKLEEYGDIGVAYEDPYFIVVRDAVRFPSGRRGAYVRFMGADPGTNAAVLPLLADGRVLLVRHFRHGSRQWHWEIPRGFSPPGADGATTARQEMLEETGVCVNDVLLLGRVCTDADFDEIYLASLPAGSADGLVRTADAAEEGIDEVRLVTLGELNRMMTDGEIDDMYLLSAYALATAKGLLKP
ncbi:MAG TPA: NUDIX hydrolase [Micromonosporaceae bacterium]|nr:NUDIX hydrolase [Micromonosporaceae bacterium]